MVGWQIEIANDSQQLESGVIKRVDADINCALVAFESGKKEWLDLTLSVFKVLVQHAEKDGDQGGLETDDHSNDTEASHEASVAAMQPHSEHWMSENGTTEGTRVFSDPDRQNHSQQAIPPLDVPTRSIESSTQLMISYVPEAVQFASKPPPESDVTSFDWYSEGGHVEICDPSGKFIEGAILCSKTDTHVHLYSETRQFFEVVMAAQSFKVVIHGLLSLKWIPMGQALEVYSAMTGGFHWGIAIKAAEVSKLTPVRFSSGAVEWLDLSTQTFKLVFLSSNQNQGADDEEISSLSKAASSPTHKAHRHHHHTAAVELPSLHVGQRVEIFEAPSKQFAKYKVAAASGFEPHEYEFEPQTLSSSSGSMASRISANLTQLRCRISLTPHMWSEYRHILAGHRIDMYDKAKKTVVTAKILEVGSRDGGDHQHQHAMLVRYKDGQKSWIHAQSVKVKLRLQGEPLDLQNGHGSTSEADTNLKSIAAGEEEPANVSEGDTAGEMWERPVRAETSPRDSELGHQASATKHHLLRHRSDLAALPAFPVDTAPQPQSQLSHAASAGNFFRQQRSIEIESMAMTQKIPSIVQPLDFSSLRKLRPVSAITSSTDEPVFSIASEPGGATSGSSRSSARSRKSDSSSRRSSRLPFTMADVWRQELNSELDQVEYVNNGSGALQSQVPEWLERVDEASGKLFVVHTPSSTLYSVPTATTASTMESEVGVARVSSSRANSSAPGSAHSSSALGDSGGRVVVPVGPLEAVRVYNMLEK